ncbi:MAG: hypothetical protein HKN41_08295 [Ilumatobacter sp.]|nr:hypothetical protein [Ilumatobacter sp.]
MDNGSPARDDDPVGEIEVFPTGRTIEVAPTAPEVGEHLRHGLTVLRAGYERASTFHATPGPRPGVPVVPATSSRRGGDADVVRPVLVEPALAASLATTGSLFRPPVEHLVIRDDDDPASSQLLVWDVVLLDDHAHPTPATLHLLAAPSMVVTVLELIPRRRLRWTKQQFIDDGVAVLDELAARLVAARRPLRSAV